MNDFDIPNYYPKSQAEALNNLYSQGWGIAPGTLHAPEEYKTFNQLSDYERTLATYLFIHHNYKVNFMKIRYFPGIETIFFIAGIIVFISVIGVLFSWL